MQPKKRLSDILQGNDREHLSRSWSSAQAARELGPLPPGEYICRCVSGELFNSGKKGTPGYKLTLEVAEGEHVGGRVWHDLWLTPTALPMTKRDLAKLGINTLEQLDQPLPAGVLLRVRLSRREDDDGTERNRVIRFDYHGVEPGDAFTPETSDTGEPLDTSFDVAEIEASTGPAGAPAEGPPSVAPEVSPLGALKGRAQGKGRKPQQASLGLEANGEASSGPYAEGR